MISLTRLNGRELVVNGDLICYMEAAPDTVLTLTNGLKLVVRESCEAVASLVLAYRARALMVSGGIA
jgi:flagellar protein FlbD